MCMSTDVTFKTLTVKFMVRFLTHPDKDVIDYSMFSMENMTLKILALDTVHCAFLCLKHFDTSDKIVIEIWLLM